MKKIFMLLSFIVIQNLTAQNLVIEGKIIDEATKEAIPFTNIYDLNSTQGVISNDEGVFKFFIPSNAKTIEISHLGYKSKSIALSEIPEGFAIFFLEADELALEEVIVTNKPVSEILNKIIDNSKLQLDKSIKLETYYREFVKINNQYSKFADGLIDFYLKPKRKTKIEANLIVNESRAFQLATKENIEAKGTLDMSELGSFFDIQNAANGFFSFELDKITSKRNSAKYDFELRSKKDSNGNTIETVYIIPKENIKEVLLEGKVSYDPEKKIILEIDLKMSDKHKQYVEMINALVMKFAIYDIQIIQTYKFVNGKYIPSYRKSIADIHIKFGKKMDDRFMCISDLLVTNFFDNLENYPTEELFFKEKDLYSNGMNFKENFWETNNVIPLSSSEEAIINKINGQ
jgi:hypothetical protein